MSIERLKEGNARFVADELEHPNRSAAHRETVVSKQDPFAIVVCCSDSRVPPEVAFDCGVGDLFVVRTAGHVIDTAALASVEYAVAHLKTPLLLVLGHTSCGAVTAAVQGESGSVSIDALVAAIRPAVEDAAAEGGDVVGASIRRHVANVVGQLADTDPIIKPAVASGALTVQGAIYDLATGKVDFVGAT